MKLRKIYLIPLSLLIIAACTSRKKATSSTDSSTSATPPPTTTVIATPTVAAGPMLSPRSTNGIYEPGDAELTAIKAKIANATLEQLKEGYTLYTGEKCTGCHQPVNVYHIPPNSCKDIIDNMGFRARLSNQQSNAVYAFVMSVKATQPK